MEMQNYIGLPVRYTDYTGAICTGTIAHFEAHHRPDYRTAGMALDKEYDNVIYLLYIVNDENSFNDKEISIIGQDGQPVTLHYADIIPSDECYPLDR